jgi:hypothetical protein
MKITNCVFATVLALSLFNITGCSAVKSESKKLDSGTNGKATLSLILMLDKTLYKSNETIEADVLLKNTGTGINTIVNSRMAVCLIPNINCEITLVIKSPSGDFPDTTGNWRNRFIIEGDFIVLSPRRGILASYNIQSYYTLDEYGTYSVYAVYQNQLDPQKGSTAWKGDLTSNTVHFEITP